jgi:hypothetical protein
MVAHRLGQRRPSDITRGQPRHRASQIRVDHVRGEHAAHLPGRGDFLLEPSPERGIRSQFSPDDLYGDLLPARRQAKEYPSHTAAAQLPKQPIRPDRTRVVRLKRRYQTRPPLQASPTTLIPVFRGNAILGRNCAAVYVDALTACLVDLTSADPGAASRGDPQRNVVGTVRVYGSERISDEVCGIFGSRR